MVDFIPTPDLPDYFDYLSQAQQAGLSPSELRAICEMFERDYPDDLMLRELKILRCCMSLARGSVTIAEVLACASQDET